MSSVVLCAGLRTLISNFVDGFATADVDGTMMFPSLSVLLQAVQTLCVEFGSDAPTTVR